jgi:hypothetical protein
MAAASEGSLHEHLDGARLMALMQERLRTR